MVRWRKWGVGLGNLLKWNENTLLQRHSTLLQRHSTLMQRHSTLMQRLPTLLQRHSTLLQRLPTLLQRHFTLMQRPSTLLQKPQLIILSGNFSRREFALLKHQNQTARAAKNYAGWFFCPCPASLYLKRPAHPHQFSFL